MDLRERQKESIERLCVKTPKGTPVDTRMPWTDGHHGGSTSVVRNIPTHEILNIGEPVEPVAAQETRPSSDEEPREINLTAALRSGPEYSFTPHPKADCRRRKTVHLPGPGEYYRAEQDDKEKSKPSFSIGPSINDLGGCPVELLHCSHCDKKTVDNWTPPVDARGKRPRPKECATKGCAHLCLLMAWALHPTHKQFL
eukprot:Skav214093  [mRNA]  locus=scaffold1185:64684:65682:+ [translate_table: standard]